MLSKTLFRGLLCWWSVALLQTTPKVWDIDHSDLLQFMQLWTWLNLCVCISSGSLVCLQASWGLALGCAWLVPLWDELCSVGLSSSSWVQWASLGQFFSWWRQKGKGAISQGLFKPLLITCLLTFHWPKRVAWLNSDQGLMRSIRLCSKGASRGNGEDLGPFVHCARAGIVP